MSRETGARVTPNVVIGILAIIIGVQMTLSNLGWMDPHVLRYWPVAVVAIGLAMVLNPSAGSQRPGWIVLAIGAWLTATSLYGAPFEIWDLWPLALVLMGLAMIRRGREHAMTGARPEPGAMPAAVDFGVPSSGRVEPVVPTGAESAHQSLSAFAFWSGIQRRVTSVAFRRADLVAVMGAVEVDLRQASTTGEAVIDVFALWGGIEIKVPPDWHVDNEVVAIMGAAEDKSTGMQGARHRVRLTGFVLMGGVEVKT